MLANIRPVTAIIARLNRLGFNDADAVRAFFSELIGMSVDDSCLLILGSIRWAARTSGLGAMYSSIRIVCSMTLVVWTLRTILCLGRT